MRARLDALFDGPPPRLPALLDRAGERWAALRPRARRAAVAGMVVLALAVHQWRVTIVEGQWGGTPVSVLVAGETLAVGSAPAGLRRITLPPAAVPPSALAAVPPDAVLALALPEGAILTARHLDPQGPAAGLPPGLRAVPLPAEEGWSLSDGSWVDVWVLVANQSGRWEEDAQSDAGAPATLVARSRPVLEVRVDGRGATALVGLTPEEVSAVTSGLAVGRILLTHAPAPPM